MKQYGFENETTFLMGFGARARSSGSWSFGRYAYSANMSISSIHCVLIGITAVIKFTQLGVALFLISRQCAMPLYGLEGALLRTVTGTSIALAQAAPNNRPSSKTASPRCS